MAKASGQKPDIAGGRTLAKMRRGHKGGGAGGTKNRKRVWFQAGPDKGQGKGKLGAWPTGDMPEDVRKRLDSPRC